MSPLKELAPLIISVLALAISSYNFYVQQFRKRDKLIGHLIQISVNDGEFSFLNEYSVANVGDTQLLIKNISVLCSADFVHYQLKSSCSSVPCILKPGDIAVLGVMYNQEEIEQKLSEGERCVILLEVLSPKGVCYRLPHHFKGEGVTRESVWSVFALAKEHAPVGTVLESKLPWARRSRQPS